MTFVLSLCPLLSGVLMWLALKRDVSIPVMSFFGAVSFGWYLLHAVAGFPLRSMLTGQGVSDSQAALVAALATLALSWIAHLAIDKPGIAMGKSPTRLLAPRPQATG